jgi:hypothetical protein
LGQPESHHGHVELVGELGRRGDAEEAAALYNSVVSPFVTSQELTLTSTLKSGSVTEVTQKRTLMNMTDGKLNAFDPKIGAQVPGYTYKQEPLKGRAIK